MQSKLPEICMIANTVIDMISDWNNDILDPVHLHQYADAIYQRGAAVKNCFGFIVDETVGPTCRPGNRGSCTVDIKGSTL